MRLLLSLAFYTLAEATLTCRPEGPVVPKPSLASLKSSNVVSEAVANLTATFDDALSGVIKGGWEVKNGSFSVALVSADQSDAGTPIWEYHHLAEANTRGTKKLDRDSQYLIGSISKLLSDYVMLQTDVDIDTPITEYLPRLKEPGAMIQWGEVTLRMLGEHLAGVPVNYGFSEYYFLKEVFLSYGLPPIKDSDYPSCGVTTLNGGCSPQQFIDGMHSSYPTTALNQRPAYSSVSFTLIFMAIENVTGKNYTELLDEHLSKPLGLKNTMPSPGDDEKAVIPPGESTWGADYSFNVPGGGLVSSLSDLSKFAHGILSRSVPMTEAEIRGWLKPTSFNGGSVGFVGLPWEIYRPADLTPDHPHPISVYGKGGGAQGYRTQISLVDEYGVGIIVLTAGPPQLVNLLTGALMTTLVPAVDEAARLEAQKGYSKTFETAQKNSANSTTVSATFALDDDSLVIKELANGDADILTALVDIWGFTMGQYGFAAKTPIRLFPDDLDEVTILRDGTKVTKETWRVWPETGGPGGSDLPGNSYQSDDCLWWTLQDWVHYGSEPVDRVLFYKDMEGEVIGFEAPFLRSGILRPS